MDAADLLASPPDERSLLLLVYTRRDRAARLAQALPDRSHDIVSCPAAAPLGPWVQELRPDLVLLDPPEDRDELLRSCETLRASSDRPIVVLSEQRDELVVARALASGIDEYLVLPIGDQELIARLDAMLRRIRRAQSSNEPAYAAGLTLSSLDLSAEVNGRKAYLSPTEFRLLSCLASAPGKVLTHETLMSRVWGAEYVASRHYLHLYIRYLREKLEADSTKPQFIISEWGVGYRFQVPERSGP